MNHVSRRIPQPLSDDRGFALLVVISTVGLMALLVAAFSLSVRTELRSTAAAVENAKAEALADGGASLAILNIIAVRSQSGTVSRFPPDGSPVFCAMSGGVLRVTVEDESARIDLNTANDRLLRAALLGLGLSETNVTALADAVIDFRDPDDHRRANGAETAEYNAAGLLHGPKNAPFARAEELAQVLGFDSATLNKLLPFTTVHSGQSGLDATLASPELVSILARGYGRLDSNRGANPQQVGLASAQLPAEFAVASPQRVFTIRAEARTRRNSAFVREAVVEFPKARNGATHIIKEWRRGRGLAPDFRPHLLRSALPPC